MIQTRDVVRFWLPLSFTWLMMAAEGPILTSVVARMSDAMFNLAAYGVTLAIGMLIESPVINLLSTTVALAKDRASAEQLKTFMWKVNILVTVGMLVVCIPFVFDLVAYAAIGLDPNIGWRVHLGLMCMILWPGAIGYRRYYQGLLIRHRQTRLVAYGTVVRLITMAGSAGVLMLIGNMEGIIIGAASITSGVIWEALATRWMAKDVVRTIRAQSYDDCESAPTDRQIMKFYIPLAMTSTVGFLVTPMVAFFLNRAPEALASLAVLPVVDSFVFFFRSFGFSYQEVGVAYLGMDRTSYPALRKVGQWIVIATTVTLVAITASPLLDLVYGGIYGLNADLVQFARIPTMLLTVLPAVAVLYSLQRSVLIAAHRTLVVTVSTVLELVTICLVMILAINVTPWTGAIAAALAMSVGRVAANSYSAVWSRRIRQAWTLQKEVN